MGVKGGGRGRVGGAGAGRKPELRPENLKGKIKTQAESAPGAAGPGRGRRRAGNGLLRARSRRQGRARPGPARAGAGRCPFKAGGAGRPSAAVIGAAGSLAPRAGPGGVGWSPLRFDKVLATR